MQAEYQRMSKAFKKANDLAHAVPGRLINKLSSKMIQNIRYFDEALSLFLKARDKRNNQIVKHFYESMIYLPKSEAYEYVAKKLMAFTFLTEEFKKIKGTVVSFVVDAGDDALIGRKLAYTRVATLINVKYAQLSDFLVKNMQSPTFSLETQFEKVGQYQVHAHGFCSADEYSDLEAACKKAGYRISGRKFSQKIENYAAYILKDQTVTKTAKISAYKKIADVNSVKILRDTFKQKLAHIPEVKSELIDFFLSNVDEPVKKVMKRRFRVNLVGIIQKACKKLVNMKQEAMEYAKSAYNYNYLSITS